MLDIQEMSEESFTNMLNAAAAKRPNFPIHLVKRGSWTIRIIPNHPGRESITYLFSDQYAFISVVAGSEGVRIIESLLETSKHGADIVIQLRKMMEHPQEPQDQDK